MCVGISVCECACVCVCVHVSACAIACVAQGVYDDGFCSWPLRKTVKVKE